MDSDETEDIPLHPLNSPPDEEDAQPRYELGYTKRLLAKYTRLKCGTKVLLAISVSMICAMMFIAYSNGYLGELDDSSEAAPTEVRFAAIAERVLGDMDRSVDPCEHFYEYACGGWIARTQLDTDEAARSRSFSDVAEANAEQTLATLQAGWPYISTLFDSCMDEAAVASRGLAPIEAYAVQLSGADSLNELAAALGQLHLAGFALNPFFAVYVGIDDSAPSRYLLQLSQSPPTLPGAALEQDYRDWMGGMFAVSPSGALNTLQLLDLSHFQQRLVNISRSPAADRDPVATYNPRSYAATQSLLGALAPHLNALALNVSTANVVEPEYFDALDALLGATSLATVRNHALLSLYLHSYGYLDATRTAAVAGYQELLYGSAPNTERLDGCVHTTSSLLGFLVSQYFVEYHFSPERKDAVEEMILALEASYGSAIQESAWMDSETRNQAAIKLGLIENMVGYPSEWPDYDAYFSDEFRLEEARFFENALGLRASAVRREFAKLSAPVNRREWEMFPSAVNAYAPFLPLTCTDTTNRLPTQSCSQRASFRSLSTASTTPPR